MRQPSLQRISSRLHRDHLKKNGSSVGLRYRTARRLLVLAREHWRLSLVAVVLLYAAVAGTTALVPPSTYGPQIPSDVVDYYRDLQTINLALLGAQATLLGLVYPLVIALVGMLFETRSSTGHRLQIYFTETEAASVGGLALTFIAALAAQSLIYGQIPLKIVGAITVLNVLWFTVNLAALTFFVLRSLEFIQPTRRVDLAHSYIANTAWNAQLRDLLLTNRWVHAAEYGYLPADPAVSDFTITPFVRETALVTRTFTAPRRLHDVRFGVLSIALRARYSRQRSSGVEEETTLAA